MLKVGGRSVAADNRMTKQQAEALAQFLHMLRPGWEEAGIVAALGNARLMGTAGDLAIAALAAAAEPNNRTPAVIAMPGSHWSHSALRHKSSANTTPPRNRTCATCYLPEDKCRARWAHDHAFESLAEAKRRAIRQADMVPRERPPLERMHGRPVEDVELP